MRADARNRKRGSMPNGGWKHACGECAFVRKEVPTPGFAGGGAGVGFTAVWSIPTGSSAREAPASRRLEAEQWKLEAGLREPAAGPRSRRLRTDSRCCDGSGRRLLRKRICPAGERRSSRLPVVPYGCLGRIRAALVEEPGALAERQEPTAFHRCYCCRYSTPPDARSALWRGRPNYVPALTSMRGRHCRLLD